MGKNERESEATLCCARGTGRGKGVGTQIDLHHLLRWVHDPMCGGLVTTSVHSLDEAASGFNTTTSPSSVPLVADCAGHSQCAQSRTSGS
eukprot:2392056-Amphidinium_carterae.1